MELWDLGRDYLSGDENIRIGYETEEEKKNIAKEGVMDLGKGEGE